VFRFSSCRGLWVWSLCLSGQAFRVSTTKGPNSRCTLYRIPGFRTKDTACSAEKSACFRSQNQTFLSCFTAEKLPMIPWFMVVCIHSEN
jgi:hypothetical protein